MATASAAQPRPRPRRHSQLRISEMKTARPRMPSPFDTAGIVAHDHGRPETRHTESPQPPPALPAGCFRPLRRRRLRSAQALPGLPRPRSRRAGAARAPPAVRRRERRECARPPAPPGAAAVAGAVPARPQGCAPAPGHPPCDSAARNGWLTGGRAPGISRAAAGTRFPVTARKGKRARAEVRGGWAVSAAVSVDEFSARSLLGNSLIPSSPRDPNG